MELSTRDLLQFLPFEVYVVNFYLSSVRCLYCLWLDEHCLRVPIENFTVLGVMILKLAQLEPVVFSHAVRMAIFIEKEAMLEAHGRLDDIMA